MTALSRHLATIDVLRGRPFPERPGSSAGVTAGPGYHLAELSTSEGFWEDDGAGRSAAEEQCAAECAALSLLLTERWGEPDLVSPLGTRLRAAAGEAVPEPWCGLSFGVPCLEVWRADGRWIALGVSQQQEDLPFQLVAAVTEIDPP